MRRKRRSRNQQRKMQKLQNTVIALGILCIVLIVVKGIIQTQNSSRQKKETEQQQITEATIEPSSKPSSKPKDMITSTPDPEEKVYTFLQGPKSWKNRVVWSGEWGDLYVDGGYFGAFGCGLCCMANIYSTQTKYQCSPMDMYRYAKKTTYYGGGMAIEWGYMRRTLTSLGFDCSVKKKPKSYQQFVDSIKESECCIVLVSSNDSQVFWRNTPGHYVTIFLYDENSEKVFLADSGDPDHNRQWISLKKIYQSLKTSSNWQYLPVGKYHEKQDSWKHKKISGNWTVPE